ncbi:MAG: glycosyltransferase family 39 protein [Bacteroidetes bacterium]|nr:glycosyltransferase family 39 protein [Bacteroidota bacterium]
MKWFVKNYMVKQKLSNFLTVHRSAILLLLTSVLFRIVFIENQGLSNDELSAWYRTQFSDWSGFWNLAVMNGDMHPYFYQFLMTLWGKITPATDWGVRSLALLIFSFNFILIYKVAYQFFSKWIGLILLSIYASSTFLIVQTSTSRPYSIGLFFLLLLVYGFLQLLNNKELVSKKWYALLIIGFYGSMVSHYFAFIVAGVFGIVGISMVYKSQRLGVVLSGVIAVLLFLPHWEVTHAQLNVGGLGWLDAPDITWLFDFFVLVINDSTFLFFLLFLGLIILSGFKWGRNKASLFLFRSVLIVVVLVTILSYAFTPIVRELVFQFLFPFLFLGLFGTIEPKENRLFQSIPVLIVLILGFTSIKSSKLFERTHYGEFEQIGHHETQWLDSLGQKNVHLIENFNNPSYLSFYTHKKHENKIENWGDPNNPEILKNEIEASDKDYLIYNWSNNYHHSIFLEIFQQKFPKVTAANFYFNSEQYLFSKKGKNVIEMNWFLNKKKSQIDSNEFFGQFKLTVGELKKQIKGPGYFLFEMELEGEKLNEVYLVAVANRGEEMLKNGENPVQYSAYDARIVLKKSNRLFNAFVLSNDLLDSDVINFYVWNPKSQKVQFKNVRIGFKAFL